MVDDLLDLARVDEARRAHRWRWLRAEEVGWRGRSWEVGPGVERVDGLGELGVVEQLRRDDAGELEVGRGPERLALHIVHEALGRLRDVVRDSKGLLDDEELSRLDVPRGEDASAASAFGALDDLARTAKVCDVDLRARAAARLDERGPVVRPGL